MLKFHEVEALDAQGVDVVAMGYTGRWCDTCSEVDGAEVWEYRDGRCTMCGKFGWE